ncbi:MAG: hypothetical protein JWM04_2830 [Verrucomicrobiales bacterium]|nr:hypothetical protein [Verrucomicrobiales bacterium]
MGASATTTVQPVMDRFTLDGTDELESHLSSVSEAVVEGITAVVPGSRLQAIILGGGYGRGEGGVLKSPSSDLPYNDMEFYVCIAGPAFLNEKRYGRQLQDIAHRCTEKAGIEVEFKILPLEKIITGPTTMFFYDLVMGHKVLLGSPTILKSTNVHRVAANIKLAEAIRLLMNRCSGLLYSEVALAKKDFSHEDADFVGRNQCKAKLALGDVVLTVNQRYHWSSVTRAQYLQALEDTLPWMKSVKAFHFDGVDFKLHPNRREGAAGDFQQTQTELKTVSQQVWLWLENLRLEQHFADVEQYALSPINKCPDTADTKNRLINLRKFGPKSLLSDKSSRYPRERLLNTLPLLLWKPESINDPALLRFIQSELNTIATSHAELVHAYRQLWSHYN